MATEAKPVTALVRMDPQTLIASAVEKGAGVETLEKLVDLAERVRMNQARAAWYEAMSDFQSALPDIKKTSSAEIYTQRGSYRYKYAELPDIMAIVRPLLKTFGLSVFWSTKVEPGKVIANCRVAHILGHVEESGEVAMPVPDGQERGGGNPLQRVGSALSYARRYSLMAILGIAPEDDDDAQSAGRTQQKQAPTQTPRSPEASPPQATMKSEGDSPEAPAGDPPPSDLDIAWAEVNDQLADLKWTNAAIRDHCAATYHVQQRKDMTLKQVRDFYAHLVALQKRKAEQQATGGLV